MITNIQTQRLVLCTLNANDHLLMLELMNTPEWIKYIGDRNIKTKDAAKAYIEKININPRLKYWAVKLKEDNIPIGVITFIKRAYLEHHDIGFAFLPNFTNKGYAYEATKAIMDAMIKTSHHAKILAITINENIRSKKLLEKLNLCFDKEIVEDNTRLLVYSLTIPAHQ